MIRNIFAIGLLTFGTQQAFANDMESATHKNEQAPANLSVPEGLYVGGGLNYNSIDLEPLLSGADRETAMGFQLFTGLPIASSIAGFKTFAEVGFFQTENFNFGGGTKERVRGIWGAGVLQRDLNEIDPNLYGLVRAGVEMGDDDGVFMGFGAGYRMTSKVDLRAEFLNKDLLTSYQLNALVRF